MRKTLFVILVLCSGCGGLFEEEKPTQVASKQEVQQNHVQSEDANGPVKLSYETGIEVIIKENPSRYFGGTQEKWEALLKITQDTFAYEVARVELLFGLKPRTAVNSIIFVEKIEDEEESRESDTRGQYSWTLKQIQAAVPKLFSKSAHRYFIYGKSSNYQRHRNQIEGEHILYENLGKIINQSDCGNLIYTARHEAFHAVDCYYGITAHSTWKFAFKNIEEKDENKQRWLEMMRTFRPMCSTADTSIVGDEMEFFASFANSLYSEEWQIEIMNLDEDRLWKYREILNGLKMVLEDRKKQSIPFYQMLLRRQAQIERLMKSPGESMNEILIELPPGS